MNAHGERNGTDVAEVASKERTEERRRRGEERREPRRWSALSKLERPGLFYCVPVSIRTETSVRLFSFPFQPPQPTHHLPALLGQRLSSRPGRRFLLFFCPSSFCFSCCFTPSRRGLVRSVAHSEKISGEVSQRGSLIVTGHLRASRPPLPVLVDDACAYTASIRRRYSSRSATSNLWHGLGRCPRGTSSWWSRSLFLT